MADALPWGDYADGYDAERQYFTSKAAARACATAVARELGLLPASLMIEGKKSEFHVFNAYISMYFAPASGEWQCEFERHQRRIKETSSE